MRNGSVVGLGLALAVLAGSSAYAFQEQQSGVTPPVANEAGSAPAPTAEQPLNLSGETARKGESEGTEIRIPGLGKLGVLPKMDFGLELLYGAAEQKQQEVQPEAVPGSEPDDLMIRGTVKHRF